MTATDPARFKSITIKSLFISRGLIPHCCNQSFWRQDLCSDSWAALASSSAIKALASAVSGRSGV